MAAPQKEGLNYFQLDIDIYEDDKILMAQEIVDPLGQEPWIRLAVEAVAIRMLREIYKDGYYIEWNDKTALVKASKMQSVITMHVLQRIVNSLIHAEFFNKEIAEKHKVLTSHGIQKRWQFICKTAKRKNTTILPELNLLSEVIHNQKINSGRNSINSGIIPEETQKTPEETPSGREVNPHKNYTITTNTKSIGNKGLNDNSIVDYTNNSSSSGNTPEETQKTPEVIQFTPEETGGNNANNGISSGKTPEETPFTPEETEETPEDIMDYEGQWHLPTIPTAFCLQFLLTHKEFKNDKQFLYEKLHYHLSELPEDEIYDRLKMWGKVFNTRFDGEKPKRNMRGHDSWVQHLRNWFPKQKLWDSPKQIIESQSNRAATLGKKIATDQMSEADQVQHYKRKPRQ